QRQMPEVTEAALLEERFAYSIPFPLATEDSLAGSYTPRAAVVCVAHLVASEQAEGCTRVKAAAAGAQQVAGVDANPLRAGQGGGCGVLQGAANKGGHDEVTVPLWS
ncbi:hypothetical protein TcCL_ESM00871, partial [Trypanosoma cruzi]